MGVDVNGPKAPTWQTVTDLALGHPKIIAVLVLIVIGAVVVKSLGKAVAEIAAEGIIPIGIIVAVLLFIGYAKASG